MKFSITFAVLVCQWSVSSALADPGIVESFDWRKSRKQTDAVVSTKFEPSINAIPDYTKPTTPATTTTLQSFKITAEDVVTGQNSIYGSHSQPQMTNGGIIFAISNQGGSGSQYLSAAAPQPVLMQYISPNGTPQQSAVQYIQLLRPIMMVPPQPYMPAKPHSDFYAQTTTVRPTLPPPPPSPPMLSPYGPYARSPQVIGSFSTNFPSFLHSNPSSPLPNPHPTESRMSSFELGLNTNEYVPSASNRHASAVLPPQSSLSPMSYTYKPQKFQMLAQRA